MISQSKQKGFTIVELLIVIVVIGILAAISIVAYNGVTQKARDDERISDSRNIVNAAASYQAENGAWPTINQLKATTDATGNITGTTNKFTTVKLSGNASSRLGADTNGAPSSTNKDRYQYIFCNDSTTGAIAVGDALGVQVTYFNEDANAVKTIKSGSGARCA